jgi:hypothetical protein
MEERLGALEHPLGVAAVDVDDAGPRTPAETGPVSSLGLMASTTTSLKEARMNNVPRSYS